MHVRKLFCFSCFLSIFFLYLSQKIQTEASGESDRGKKGGRGKSKSTGTRKVTAARKESRTYSSLIFAMEQFEKHLIQLDKKAKVSVLLSVIKNF